MAVSRDRRAIRRSALRQLTHSATLSDLSTVGGLRGTSNFGSACGQTRFGPENAMSVWCGHAFLKTQLTHSSYQGHPLPTQARYDHLSGFQARVPRAAVGARAAMAGQPVSKRARAGAWSSCPTRTVDLRHGSLPQRVPQGNRLGLPKTDGLLLTVGRGRMRPFRPL